MVGLEKKGIICLIITQSFMYVIPAIFLAFVMSITVLNMLADIFYAEYKINLDRYPSISSSLQAIFIGTFIPLMSSIMPIQTALKMSLPDSLDNLKSKT